MANSISYLFTVFVNDITHLGSLVSYGFLVLLSWFIAPSVSLSLVLGIIILYAIVVPIRLLFYRPRPKEQSYSNFIERVDRSSFPSLHAGRMGLLCGIFMSAQFYSVVVLVATLVCVSRIILRKHHMSDIIVGFVLGILIGVFV